MLPGFEGGDEESPALIIARIISPDFHMML